jgi:hypothetical protein
MAAIAFDTLAYVRRIVAAGVPREQAEVRIRKRRYFSSPDAGRRSGWPGQAVGCNLLLATTRA